MGSPLSDHLACLQCDWKLHTETVNNHDHSRVPLCNNCVSQTASVQCLEQGLRLCQTCVSNPNLISRFFLRNVSNFNNLGFNFPLDLIDLDSSSSSSFVDRNFPLSFASLSLNNQDSSSSSFDIFQIFENYTKNYNDQQMPMLQPDFLDIHKDSSCAGFNGYETKEDIENVLLKNTFDIEDQKLFIPDVDLFPTDPIIDEITKQNANTTSTEIISFSSSVIHKDYNIEALANASSQDYYKNQMIGSSKAKEETNDLGRFPNDLVQLDCGQSQLILTDEMLSWDDQIFEAPRYNQQAREEAKQRYLAKKKNRKFGKQIRYESRKSTADTKRRMKGRFTKAGADYDYDPRADNNNNINKGTNKTMSY